MLIEKDGFLETSVPILNQHVRIKLPPTGGEHLKSIDTSFADSWIILVAADMYCTEQLDKSLNSIYLVLHSCPIPGQLYTLKSRCMAAK